MQPSYCSFICLKCLFFFLFLDTFWSPVSDLWVIIYIYIHSHSRLSGSVRLDRFSCYFCIRWFVFSVHLYSLSLFIWYHNNTICDLVKIRSWILLLWKHLNSFYEFCFPLACFFALIGDNSYDCPRSHGRIESGVRTCVSFAGNIAMELCHGTEPVWGEDGGDTSSF